MRCSLSLKLTNFNWKQIITNLQIFNAQLICRKNYPNAESEAVTNCGQDYIEMDECQRRFGERNLVRLARKFRIGNKKFERSGSP